MRVYVRTRECLHVGVRICVLSYACVRVVTLYQVDLTGNTNLVHSDLYLVSFINIKYFHVIEYNLYSHKTYFHDVLRWCMYSGDVLCRLTCAIFITPIILGLYSVEKCWSAVGMSGYLVCKYILKRLPDQAPPPWKEALDSIQVTL